MALDYLKVKERLLNDKVNFKFKWDYCYPILCKKNISFLDLLNFMPR